jgi:hypothetical protein
MMMKKSLVLLIMLATVSVAFAEQNVSTVWLSPEMQVVPLNSQFIVDIMVKTESMAGWQLKVVYDPSIIQGVKVVEGEFMQQFGRIFFVGSEFLGYNNCMGIHNEAGYISLACALLGHGLNATGQGVIVHLTFQAVGVGETDLVLDRVTLVTPLLEFIPTIHNGHVKIIVAGDVNNDGVVDIFDVVLVARCFGSTDARYDFNVNGNVDIGDILYVAEKMEF